MQVLGIGLGGRSIVRLAGVQQAMLTPTPASVVELQHNGVDPLWSSLPAKFHVVRYESVSLPEPLDPGLEKIAWGANGEPLAVKNRNKPHWALFFQPGAFGGEQSKELIRNFYTYTLGSKSGKPAQQLEWILPQKASATQYAIRMLCPKATLSVTYLSNRPTPPPTYKLNWTKFSCNQQFKDFTTERFFRFVYHSNKRPDCEIFWLDSAHVQKGGARFSFIGDTTGPNAFSLCVILDLSGLFFFFANDEI